MSRSGVEAKPAWKTVPFGVRRCVDEALGGHVVRSMRIWGGYSATPTFRLRLKDGRRAFFKAASPVSTEFGRDAHHREERVYRELDDIIGPWSPEFYGAFQQDGWAVMLLQDLGPKSAPPWTPSVLRGVSRGLGEFHQATIGRMFPDWLQQNKAPFLAADHTWDDVERDGARSAAALAGPRAKEAQQWLAAALPRLAEVSRTLHDVGQPHSLLHRDVRSDNLRWHNKALKLLDWPHPGVGPAEYDAAIFAQSVAVEGGATPEAVMHLYAERFMPRSDALDAAVAALASFFTTHAPQPDIPGLPRLRPFQRAQMKATLAWAARRLDLPAPLWLDAVN